MREKILACIVKTTGREELQAIRDDETFDSHDVDSLDRMSIMLEVEEAFGVELEEEESKSINCLNDYINVLSKHTK